MFCLISDKFIFKMADKTSHIVDAFKKLVDAEPTITIVTGDGEKVEISNFLLMIFSPLMRATFNSQTHWVHPTLLLPEFSSQDVQHLLNILTSGDSFFGTDLFNDVKGVTTLATTLGIEMFSLEQYEATEPKLKAEQIKMEITEPFDYFEEYDGWDDEDYVEGKERVKRKYRKKDETK